MSEDGDVGGAVVLAVARSVFPKQDVKLPMQGILDPPVGAGSGYKDLGFGHSGEGKYAGIGLHFSIDFPACLDPTEGLQAWKIMVFFQSLSRDDHACPGLPAAMPDLLVPRGRMVGLHFAESGAGVRQQRILVGLQRQAIVATACGDCCNHTAIAMQSVCRDDLAFQRDQTEHLASSSPPLSAATLASVRRRRAA